MSKINFFLKDRNKDKTAIDAIVRFRGERYKISTKISVESKFWDDEKYRCRLVRDYSDAGMINHRLDQFEIKLKTIFVGYELKGLIPSKEQLRIDLSTEKKEGNRLSSVIREFLDKSSYAIETRKKYTTMLHWIEAYEKKFKTVLLVSDIDLSWYDRFKKFFQAQTYEKKVNGVAEKRHYTLNYWGSLIKCLKVVLNDAGKDLDVQDDVLDRKFRTEMEESDSIYLNESELKRIVDFVPSLENIHLFTKETRVHNNLRTIELLKNVKSRFLMGCYTALRVSDFKRIDLSNVRDGFIRIKPKKGVKLNKDVVIPIHPVVKAIFDSGFDFEKKVYEQKINDEIKKICKAVGINDMVSTTRTEGGKQIERTYQKWQLVTTHTARRSGATNMFKAGIPSISIMKITGHRTEKSFLKYIKITQEENAELLAKHPFFSTL